MDSFARVKILALNAGSSSQKIALFGVESAPDARFEPLWERSEAANVPLEQLIESLWVGPDAPLENAREIGVVGHRVVHGGREFSSPTPISPAVKNAIARLCTLAPAHNPAALRGIEVAEKLLPHARQIAVFDTGFHAHLPDAAAFYPLPWEWSERGIRRFGFHGISHQFCAQKAASLLERDLGELQIISCHLGNGASLAAIDGGRSVDTTMGFTPLEGVMMGTRSGSIDAGILLYLGREQGLSFAALDHMLNDESGLKGVSGTSGDWRAVMAARDAGEARSVLAFDMMVHRLGASIAAMRASLCGLDALIFTGGIGQNSPELRAAVCKKVSFLGVALSPDLNESNAPDSDIAALSSPARVLVIGAREEEAIARMCWELAG